MKKQAAVIKALKHLKHVWMGFNEVSSVTE